jgi:hypothetical protein
VTWTVLSFLSALNFGDFFFALLLSASPSQESIEKKENRRVQESIRIPAAAA